jgi:hypothetical protein
VGQLVLVLNYHPAAQSASYVISVVEDSNFEAARLSEIVSTIWGVHSLIRGAHVLFVFPNHPAASGSSFKPIKQALKEAKFEYFRIPYTRKGLARSEQAGIYSGGLIHQLITYQILSSSPAYREVGRQYLACNIFRIQDAIDPGRQAGVFRWDIKPSPQLQQLVIGLVGKTFGQRYALETTDIAEYVVRFTTIMDVQLAGR